MWSAVSRNCATVKSSTAWTPTSENIPGWCRSNCEENISAEERWSATDGLWQPLTASLSKIVQKVTFESLTLEPSMNFFMKRHQQQWIHKINSFNCFFFPFFLFFLGFALRPYSRGASQFQITLAQHSLKDAQTQKTRMVSVNRIIMHPNYISRKVADDIALIHLKEQVQWSDFVQPACLPNPNQETFSGVLATVAGWGWTDEVKNGIKDRVVFHHQPIDTFDPFIPSFWSFHLFPFFDWW